MEKYLNYNGLSAFWDKIKNYVDDQSGTTVTYQPYSHAPDDLSRLYINTFDVSSNFNKRRSVYRDKIDESRELGYFINETDTSYLDKLILGRYNAADTSSPNIGDILKIDNKQDGKIIYNWSSPQKAVPCVINCLNDSDAAADLPELSTVNDDSCYINVYENDDNVIDFEKWNIIKTKDRESDWQKSWYNDFNYSWYNKDYIDNYVSKLQSIKFKKPPTDSTSTEDDYILDADVFKESNIILYNTNDAPKYEYKFNISSIKSYVTYNILSYKGATFTVTNDLDKTIYVKIDDAANKSISAGDSFTFTISSTVMFGFNNATFIASTGAKQSDWNIYVSTTGNPSLEDNTISFW